MPTYGTFPVSRPADLSLDLLRTFATLLRHGGDAAAAARELGINQPSMSKRLAQLRLAGPVLSRPWLTRSGKLWRPTAEGDRARAAVEEVLQRYDRLRAAAPPAGPAGPAVAFACGQEAAGTFVREAVRRFHARHPGVRLRVSTPRTRARLAGVADGTFDLAAVVLTADDVADATGRALDQRLLAADPLVLAAARSAADQPWWPAWRALPAAGVKPKALVGLPLIVPEPDAAARRPLDRALARGGVRAAVDVVLELGGWPTLLAYVRDGLGVGVASAAAAAGADDLEVKPLDARAVPPPEVRLVARRRGGKYGGPDLSDEARAFYDTLLEVTADRRPRQG
jgi:DNA-binding transcriptional LysR family regulator